MKVKPFMEELIILALNFIENDLGEKKVADKLREKHGSSIPEWVLKNNLLLEKGLIKSIKSFIQMDKKMKAYFTSRKPES